MVGVEGVGQREGRGREGRGREGGTRVTRPARTPRKLGIPAAPLLKSTNRSGPAAVPPSTPPPCLPPPSAPAPASSPCPKGKQVCVLRMASTPASRNQSRSCALGVTCCGPHPSCALSLRSRGSSSSTPSAHPASESTSPCTMPTCTPRSHDRGRAKAPVPGFRSGSGSPGQGQGWAATPWCHVMVMRTGTRRSPTSATTPRGSPRSHGRKSAAPAACAHACSSLTIWSERSATPGAV